MTEPPVIETRDLAFSYNGFAVFDDVNLSLGAREFVSIVGPNGGGKTTLLRIILGLLKPTRGEIRVFGLSPQEARPRIGYMPQHVQLDPSFPVSVADVVRMGRLGRGRSLGPYSREDRETADDALREVELYDKRSDLFSSLSGGQRQRALIARALACRPELLLLDEPAANLDLAVESRLFELLKELNRRLTIVLVSHDLGFVSQYVGSVVCVGRKVHVHPTSEITGELICEIYGSDVRMVRHDHQDEKGTPH